ncbi:hypothetical protein E3N88_37091 [Mikania micrantha]|uniref:Pectinesterase inhibitor domain-containing protein n=1 Tax=Mikania micrantha TaxID=192012 RepID=A0A5N6M661_9ASTR|nr:hypothetical protein E3N88_37091 [Mikania micrantha]
MNFATQIHDKKKCRSALYSDLCVQTLIPYVSKTRLPISPQLLAQISLASCLSKARFTKIYLNVVAKKLNQTTNKQAIEECIQQINDGVNQITQSFKELQKIGKDGDENLMWHESNVETWVSAALTDATTCIDGILGGGINNRELVMIKARLLNVKQMASNLLSMFSRFTTRYRASCGIKNPEILSGEEGCFKIKVIDGDIDKRFNKSKHSIAAREGDLRFTFSLMEVEDKAKPSMAGEEMEEDDEHLDKYQEQGQLLEPYLESIISPLMLCGYEAVIRFFPHHVSDLEPAVCLLEKCHGTTVGTALRQESTGEMETKCVILLWLSILVFVPFDISSVDTSIVNTQSVDANEPPPLVARILKISKEYLSSAGPMQTKAGFLLSKLLTRPDMRPSFTRFDCRNFLLINTIML